MEGPSSVFVIYFLLAAIPVIALAVGFMIGEAASQANRSMEAVVKRTLEHIEQMRTVGGVAPEVAEKRFDLEKKKFELEAERAKLLLEEQKRNLEEHAARAATVKEQQRIRRGAAPGVLNPEA